MGKKEALSDKEREFSNKTVKQKQLNKSCKAECMNVYVNLKNIIETTPPNASQRLPPNGQDNEARENERNCRRTLKFDSLHFGTD